MDGIIETSPVGSLDVVLESRVAITVCICTYHRPQIADTLRAVAAQEGCDGFDIGVVVADNAQEPTARDFICSLAAELGLALTYVHAPARNISIARNACLAAARGDWIAFVDDDVRPSSVWLKELVAEADRRGWDAVLGPARAVYPEATPAWIRISDFHSSKLKWVRGRIVTGYTTNVLLRRRLIVEAGLGFCVELGQSGGEDTDFFYRFCDAGGRIGFAPRALAYEPVPLDRVNFPYLVKRNFRQGQTYARRLLQCSAGPLNVFLNIQLALAKALLLGLGSCLPNRSARNRCMVRAALHCGVVARLCGLTEIRLY